jgi:hypothetical protein
MTLEETLAQGIPRAEAAEYFIRVRGRDKLAALSPADLEAGLAELEPAERTALVKSAVASHFASSLAGRVKRADGAGAGTPPPTLPATGQGKNMVNATPPPLPTTALGDNKTAALTAQQQKTIDELGSARGRAATSAHFEREKHRGSEKNRELIGRLAGGVGGGAIAHLGAKNPLATIAGAALGQHFGGKAGKRSGQVADAAAWERKHSEALKWALDASGLAPSHDPALEQAFGAQQMQAQPGQPPQAQGVEPVLDPETQQHVDQEQAGEAVAEEMHADMLRQKLQEAQSELQMAQQQAQSGQEAQAGHDQQLAAMQQQIAAATTQATQAQDQVLQNQQAAAAMRMAFQQLRGQVLQLAASDPPMMSTDAQALLAAQGTQPSPGGQPEPQQGPANLAGAPGTAPGAAAPAGEADMNQPATGGATGPATTAPASEKGTAEQPEGSGDNKGSESKPVSVKVGHAVMAKLALDFHNLGVGDKTFNLAKEKGLRRVGQLLSGSRAGKMRDAGEALAGYTAKHKGHVAAAAQGVESTAEHLTKQFGRAQNMERLKSVGTQAGVVGGVGGGAYAALKKPPPSEKKTAATAKLAFNIGTVAGAGLGYGKARRHGEAGGEGAVRGAVGGGVGEELGGLGGMIAHRALSRHSRLGNPAVLPTLGRIAGSIGGYKVLTHKYDKKSDDKKSDKKTKAAFIHIPVAAMMGGAKAERAAGPDAYTEGALRGGGGAMLGSGAGALGGAALGAGAAALTGRHLGPAAMMLLPAGAGLGALAGGIGGYKALTSKYDKKTKAAQALQEAAAELLPFVGRGKTAALKDFAAAAAGRLLPVLPHAAVGAAVGAGMGAGEAYSSNEPLRQKIESLEAKPDRGYTDTMNLAQAKARHTVGEFAQDHPKTMMGMGAMGGALLGAQSGPGLVDSVRNSARSVANSGKLIKTIADAKNVKGAA